MEVMTMSGHPSIINKISCNGNKRYQYILMCAHIFFFSVTWIVCSALYYVLLLDQSELGIVFEHDNLMALVGYQFAY